MAETGRAVAARRSTSTAGPSSARGRTASRTTPSTAHAGSRSGTWSSWSSSRARTARERRCRCSRWTRAWAWSGDQRDPGGAHQLRHGPVHADPRRHARPAGPRSGGVRGGAIQLPGHRRSLPRRHVPRRRRRHARQRGPRLRAAPHHPPGGAPRPPARARGAVHGRDRRCRDRRDEGRLSVPGRAAREDPAGRSARRRRNSRAPSSRARASSRPRWRRWPRASDRSDAGPRASRKTPRCCPGRSRSGFTTPTASPWTSRWTWPPIWRAGRPGRLRAPWPSRRSEAASGAKADLARHAELGDLYQSILRSVGETRFLG